MSTYPHLFSIVLSALLFMVNVSHAQTPKTSNAVLHPLSIEHTPSFDLSDAQMARYQMLMQQGAALWYGHLHPLEVLGLYAQTSDERREYAHQVAKLRTERVAREIAFQQALDAANQTLYRNMQPIQPFNAPQFANAATAAQLQAGDHLWWVVHRLDDNDHLSALLSLLSKHPEVTLTVFVADPNVRQVLQHRFNKHPVATHAIRRQQIQWTQTQPDFLPEDVISTSHRLYHQRDNQWRPFELPQVTS